MKNDEVMNFFSISVASFQTLSRHKNVQIFAVFMKNLDIQLRKANYKTSTDSKTVISSKYHDFFDVCSKQKIDELSSHRKHHHRIELEEDHKDNHEHVSLYSMSEGKLLLMKKYLQKHLDKEFIQADSASYAFLILFEKKAEEELRFCVNYCKLNAITKRNRYLFPLSLKRLSDF